MAIEKKLRIVIEAVYPDKKKAREVIDDLNNIAGSVNKLSNLNNAEHLSWAKKTAEVSKYSTALRALAAQQTGTDSARQAAYAATRDQMLMAQAEVTKYENLNRQRAEEAKKAKEDEIAVAKLLQEAEKVVVQTVEKKGSAIERLTAKIQKYQDIHLKSLKDEESGGKKRMSLMDVFSNKIEGAISKNKTLGDVISMVPPKVGAIAVAGAAAATGIGLITFAAKKAYDAIAAVVSKILEIGEAGARFAQIEKSFYNYADTVGGAAKILDELRTASHGTISDMNLMANYFTLVAGSSAELSGFLTEQVGGIMNVAKAAAKLNPTLGDTDFMFQSLARGLKRLEFRLIDNLGINVKIGQANEAYAKILGKTVEELTSAEATMALVNAVMEAGDNILHQVGGTTESLVDPFERLTASKENAKNEMHALLGEWLNAAGIANQFARDLDVLTKAFRYLRGGIEETNAIKMAREEYEKLANISWGAAIAGLDDFDNGTQRLSESVKGLSFEALKGLEALTTQTLLEISASAEVTQQWERGLEVLRQQIIVEAAIIEEKKKAIELAKGATEEEIAALDKINQARAAVFVSLAKEHAMLKESSARLLDYAAKAKGVTLEAIIALSVGTGDLTSEQAELIRSLVELDSRQRDVNLSSEDAEAHLLLLNTAYEENRAALDELSISTDEYNASINEQKEEVKRLESVTKENNKTAYQFIDALDRTIGFLGDTERMTMELVEANDEGLESVWALIGGNRELTGAQKDQIKALILAVIAHKNLAQEHGATSKTALDAAVSVSDLTAELARSLALMKAFDSGLSEQFGAVDPRNLDDLKAILGQIDEALKPNAGRSSGGARVESLADTTKKLEDIESELAKKIVDIQEKTQLKIEDINTKAAEKIEDIAENTAEKIESINRKSAESAAKLAESSASRIEKLESDRLSRLEQMNEEYQQRITETTLQEEGRRSQIMLGFLDKYEKAMLDGSEPPSFDDLADQFIKAKAAAGDTSQNIIDVATGAGMVSAEVAGAAKRAEEFTLALEALAEASLPVEEEIAALQELQRQYEANEQASLEKFGISIETAGEKARRVHQKLLDDKKTYEQSIANQILLIQQETDKAIRKLETDRVNEISETRLLADKKIREIEAERHKEVTEAVEEEKRLIGVELAQAWEKVGGVSASVAEQFKKNVAAMIGDVDSFTERVQELVKNLEKVAPLNHNIPSSNPNQGWTAPPSSAAPAQPGGGGDGGSTSPYSSYGNNMFAPLSYSNPTWSRESQGVQFVSNDTVNVVTQSNSAAVFAANMIRDRRRQAMDAVLSRSFA